MANPQLEDGYTRIANALLEAICRYDFNGLQLRVLLLFIRQSYGYGKRTASLSADYIHKSIGTSKRYAQKIVKSLIDGNILIVESEATFSSPRKLSINKNWEEWDVIKPQSNDKDTEVQSVRTTEVQSVRTTEVQSDTHKRKNKEIYKENNIIQERVRIPQPQIPYDEIQELYNQICVSYSKLTKLSDARKKAIKARLHTYTIDDFKRLFEQAEESSFLKGKNDRNWMATFDWLIKDSNMAKVLDGNYNNRDKEESGNDGNIRVLSANEIARRIQQGG